MDPVDIALYTVEFSLLAANAAVGFLFIGLINVGAPAIPHDSSARMDPSGCHTITVRTGTDSGAGTDGRVHLASNEKSKSHWLALHKSGNLFERGAQEEFPDQCGSFVLTPKNGDRSYLTLGMSGNGYQQNDQWQVTSVSVGTRTFSCGNQWVRPGQLLNCFASPASRPDGSPGRNT